MSLKKEYAMKEIQRILSDILRKDQIYKNELMKKHTSFAIGGAADFFVTPEGEIQLVDLIRSLKAHDVPYFIMGNGTNILVRDKGVRAVVVKIGEGLAEWTIHGDEIRAQSGMLLSSLSKKAASAKLTGLEFAGGIPGSVGGALYMNAGAYGGNMSDVVKSVKVIKPSGEIAEFSLKEMCYGYRSSAAQRENLIILEGTFMLKAGDKEEIKNLMNEYAERRANKQPLQALSAGSVFKRPEGYFAGKLIEDAGLKGMIHRGAQVSSKHSGFIINRKDASATDVTELINFIKKTVYDTSGVQLEEEVKIIGEE